MISASSSSSVMSSTGGAAQTTVPQDRDAFGESTHLGKAVRDVDDGRLLLGRLSDPVEEHVDGLLAEWGGWFVEDQDAGPDREGLGQLQEVLLGDREVDDTVLEVDREPDIVEERLHGIPLVSRLAQPGLRHRDPEVLGDRHVGQHGRVLVDDRDTGLRGRCRVEAVEDVSVENQRPLVGPQFPGGNAHQGRLPRAVLTEQRMHLARAELQ